MPFRTCNASASASRGTVYLVAGDAAARAGMSAILAGGAWAVRGFAGAATFLEQALGEQPSCLLLGAGGDGCAGLAFQQLLLRREIDLPLIVCGKLDAATAVLAMKAGAFDVLLAPVARAPLRASVEQALRHDQLRRQRGQWRAELRRRHASLTPREKQVMALVMESMMNKQVARVLAISEISVKVHRGNMMRKMAAATLVDLVGMDHVLHPRSALAPAAPAAALAGRVDGALPAGMGAAPGARAQAGGPIEFFTQMALIGVAARQRDVAEHERAGE